MSENIGDIIRDAIKGENGKFCLDGDFRIVDTPKSRPISMELIDKIGISPSYGWCVEY